MPMMNYTGQEGSSNMPQILTMRIDPLNMVYKLTNQAHCLLTTSMEKDTMT